MVSENVVLVNKSEGLALVTINRPNMLNALNENVFSALEDVFNALAVDDEVRAVILTGAGNKAFVGGSDIEMMANATPAQSRTLCSRFHDIFFLIENFEKPVIAAVNGYTLGGGCELSLVCDMRIASEKAQFAFPETSLGIIPGSGGTQRLPRLIGKSRAKYMILSAAYIDAQTALSYGLVDQVVPPDELISTCKRIAQQFIKQPQLSLALAKRAINLADKTDLQTGVCYEIEAFTVAFSSEEKQKCMEAFLNRRK